MKTDTIAAIATAPGQGGIGIIRISGPETEKILNAVFVPAAGKFNGFHSHEMVYGAVCDGNGMIDECMAVLMRAPRSYTREDVAELQLHGGGYNLTRALECCLDNGARLAEPGEFTRRAFANGRIDLSRAEAVMQLISARGEQEHRAAVRQLEGRTASYVRSVSDELYQIQAGLAACIDYPEEIPDEEGAAGLEAHLLQLIDRLMSSVDERCSRLLSDGLQVVLAGRPNVGKSSILNSLLGEERAIVTQIPGTTRDPVKGEMTLNGIRICITDTAGLRNTDDPVERIGVERSVKELKDADLVLFVLDGSESLSSEEEKYLKSMKPSDAVLINKSDLPLRITEKTVRSIHPDTPCIVLSAHDLTTLTPIKELIRTQAEISDRIIFSQPRHAALVRKAVAHLKDAVETLHTLTLDFVSVDLQAAQNALAEITGDQVSEKILDTVFSRFCVGK